MSETQSTNEVDPFGAPDEAWTVSESVQQSSEDPFANAVVDVESLNNNFEQFPKPATTNISNHQNSNNVHHNNNHSNNETQRGNNEAPTTDAHLTNNIIEAQNISSTESTSLNSSSADPAILPDSASHIAHLEERLARLKHRQEQREKQAAKGRKKTEFVSITTAAELNEAENRGQPISLIEGETSNAVHAQDKNSKSLTNPVVMFDADEVKSIMAPSVVDESVSTVDGDSSELMSSSDGEAVGVVQDKTELYEHIDDKQCQIM